MRGSANYVRWLMCVLFLTWPVYAQYGGGGSGTAEDPYLINTAGQMNTIGTEPNDWDKHFKLMADIDLKDLGGSSFNLIGDASHPFKGVFDGNGHTISNLTYVVTGNEDPVDDAVIQYFGLFRYIDDPNAIIKNLSLVNPDVRPASTCQKWVWVVGALAGSVGSGSISNCSIEGGQVQGERMVGSLVGLNYGFISDCYTTCTVGLGEQRFLESIHPSFDERESFGGLVGINSGEISNCRAIGEVLGEKSVGGLAGETYGVISNSQSSGNVSGDAVIGGLVGESRRTSRLSNCCSTGHVSGRNIIGGLVGSTSKECHIDTCYATGSISAEENAGGLVGLNEGDISACYATGLVLADANCAGGLVGFNGGTIRMSCAHGFVTANDRIGGLVGFNFKEDMFLNYDPVVTDSYARGSVSGQDLVGGLIGHNQGGTALRCYSTGRVKGTTGDSWMGGLVSANSKGGLVENSFWDTETSGVNHSEGGMGKSTAEMQNMWMYLNAGWDFAGEKFNGEEDVWKMCCGRLIYPKLAWEEILVGDFVDPEGVDWLDLVFLAEHWLQTVALPCDSPDLTIDGRVDINDFARMTKYWGRGVREIIFETTLDEPPGWTAEGQWQFGTPTGGGGSVEGHPDPTSGYTGDNVYGVNLQGDYTVAVDGPHYLTAGPFDGQLYHDVRLQFARWLNTDEADYVHATIEFSFDGATWAPVWVYEDTEALLTDDAWQVVVYNLGPVADHRESLYIRWGYDVKDVEAWPMSGWNIDDVKLSGLR